MPVERVAALVLITWTWFAATSARAQDHLQPESGHLFAYGNLKIFGDYYRSIREELLVIEEDEPYFAALEIPAFTPEWALFLSSGADGRARLEVRRARSSIWYRLLERRELSVWQRWFGRNEPEGFSAYKLTLWPVTARAIGGAWESALRETRYPPPSDLVVLDGSTYHFSLLVEREGQLSGQVYAADSCTRIGQLVEFLYELRRFAVLPEAARPPQDEILDRASMLGDPARVEARIQECVADRAAWRAIDHEVQRISIHIEQLAEWQYCSCNRWPRSAPDLRAFDALHGAQRHRGDEPDPRPYFPDFDYASTQFSDGPNGELQISIPGRAWSVRVPECFDVAAVDHCPESPAKLEGNPD